MIASQELLGANAELNPLNAFERELFDRHSHDPFFKKLHETAVVIKACSIARAQMMVDTLAQDLVHSSDVRGALFFRALTKRLDRKSTYGNLYLESFEHAQIDLFNVMGRHVPLVSYPGAMANQLMMHRLQGLSEAVLIDVGIGTGNQMALLLRGIARAGSGSLKRLHVIGIEPALESLKIAERSILGTLLSQKVEIEFTAIGERVEDVSPATWKWLKNLDAPVLINAAFALHHVSSCFLKDEILARLASLNPLLFTLSEPASDHETSDLEKRFINAWHHFGLAFDYLDGVESLDRYTADSIKTLFFGREIEDILARDEHERTERHELGSSWAERLKRAGLILQQDRELLSPVEGSRLELVQYSTHVGIQAQGHTVVALLSAAGPNHH